MLDMTSFILGLQKGKSMGGGATETDILPLQDATFTYNTQGFYEWYLSPAPNTLKVGETYHIVWGEKEYICTAIDASAMMAGAIALGNLGIYGGEDTGEPFIFAYMPAVGEGVEYDTLGCLTLETDETRTVRIYQGGNANNITLLEDVPIELNLSNGNQTVLAPEGYGVKSAIITKPETLIPENIAEGVTIAGVEGTLVSGGSGSSKPLKVTWGSFDPADVGTGMLTIPHKLGVVPDMVSIQYTYCPTFNSWQDGSIIGGTMFSRAVQNRLEEDMTCTDEDASTNSLSSISTYYIYSKNTGLFGGVVASFIDEPAMNSVFGFVQNANASTFQVGGGLTGQFKTPFRYRWIAVSGLI